MATAEKMNTETKTANDHDTGKRSKLKLLVFSLIPVTVLFVIAQVLAYVTIDRSTSSWGVDPETGGRMYSMSIGHWPWSHVNRTPLNSLGLPGGEYGPVLPKGECTHVVIAGDSFTFGDGVDLEENWVSLVADRYAAAGHDRCVRIFNVAERHTTIQQQLQRVRESFDRLEPDVVVLGQYQNDLTDLTNVGSIAHLEPDETESGHDNQWGNLLARSIPGYDWALVRFLAYRAFAFMIKNDIKYEAPLSRWSVLADPRDHDRAAPLIAHYRRFYGELVAELESRDIPFGVVIFPSKLDLLAKRYPEGEFFEGLSDEFGVPRLAMYSALDSVRAAYPYHMYDGHLNEYGNEVAADQVYRWLFDGAGPFDVLH